MVGPDINYQGNANNRIKEEPRNELIKYKKLKVKGLHCALTEQKILFKTSTFSPVIVLVLQLGLIN